MKYLQLLLFVPLMFLFNACSTHQGGGGYDENSTSGMQSGPVSPASPNMRPGMTPLDPRDAQYFTGPPPLEPQRTTNP